MAALCHVPAEQLAHDEFVVGVHRDAKNWPGAHALQGVQAPAPSAEKRVAAAEPEPVLQGVQAALVPGRAPSPAVEYEPAVHRSSHVPEPSALQRPAAQKRQAVEPVPLYML